MSSEASQPYFQHSFFRNLVVPLEHGVTLYSRRAASPLVRLEKREERRKTPDHLQGVLPQNWGGTELNRTVTCMMFKVTDNDKLNRERDEALGPVGPCLKTSLAIVK
ncbi:hypothetical protein TNCV_2005731 [Trichonephila clavipes]|nr:hypothetical protein TNCV_2005731 [Trichonephila clavipes]